MWLDLEGLAMFFREYMQIGSFICFNNDLVGKSLTKQIVQLTQYGWVKVDGWILGDPFGNVDCLK